MGSWTWLGAVVVASLAADPACAQADLAALTAAALGGDADAAYRLGRTYKTGEGAPADLRDAERWFDIAARQGHAKAGTELGLVLHQEGRTAEALPWLRQGAQAGDPRAQYSLATALFAGKAVPADTDAARQWMRRAARADLPAAKEALAIMNRPPPPASAPVVRPVAARAAPPAATRSGLWLVQLGAFSVAENAAGYWRRLRANDARGLQASFPVRNGLTLLRVGPFTSRGQARRFCAGQKLQGRDCLEVAGGGPGEG